MQRVGDPVRIRVQFDRMTRLCNRPPPFLCHLTGRDGLDRVSVGTPLAGKVILYFHGGGYISGSPKTHAAMLGRLSQLSGLEVCAAPYPLAPEAPFPAAFEAAVAAWERVLRRGYRPSDVVLGGDSAGGGLALALLSHLCQRGTPPAALFAMSPWCDLTLSGESLTRNAARDPVFPAARIAELVGYVLPVGSDPADPRISPLFGAFPDCPPVLLHSSAAEILRDDARRMAGVLRGFGAEVTEYVHPTAPHVWHLSDGWLPEARRALCDIAYFANTHLRR
ncbi:alpha/beta hydrolase [Phaeobacter sp. HF9A]|nr:alpha/beta hydrolase fold domain-containing protein [Phaeobacter sp. HF9A]NIZ13954.1 alpha/beta hydrolase [Phaeobacter sp. HF9A]